MSDHAMAPTLRSAAPPWVAAAAARVRRLAAILGRAMPADARLPVALALSAVLLAFGGAALNRRAADWLMRAEIEASARAWVVGLEAALGDEL